MDNNKWEDFWIEYEEKELKISKRRWKNQVLAGFCFGIAFSLILWLIL